MPFCCKKHLSDVQEIFPALVAKSIVPVATPCARGTILVSSHKTMSTVATLVKNIIVKNNKSLFAVYTVS